MDPNQPNPGGQDGADTKPPADPPVDQNTQPEGEVPQPSADESAPTSPPSSEASAEEGAEQPAQPQTPGINEPYTPSADADNFGAANPAPEQPAVEAPAEETPVDAPAVETPAEEPPVEEPTVEETPPEQPAEAVNVEVSTDAPAVEAPSEEAPTEAPSEETPTETPAEETPPVEQPPAEQPPAEQPMAPGTEVTPTDPAKAAGEQSAAAAPAAGKKSFMNMVKDMEKAVLIAVATVAVLVMFAVLYFLFFSGDDTYAEYKSYETYNGSLSSLNLDAESSYTIDFPLAMTEDSGAASQINNWFLAADSAPNENGDEVVNSILDVRLDAQALLGTTKDEELQLLESEEFIALLEQDLTKDLNDRFAVNNPEFTFGGTTTIGVDELEGYTFDFSGTSGNPDPNGENFVIIGKYYIGFSDEVRFSVAMLGQSDFWRAGVDAGTWDAVINSLDIN